MANTLIGLLKGQTIRIDNHHRGVQNVWDSKYDIHLHKLSNNKNVDYDIKINLNHEPDENALSSLPAKIRKEIKKAASNKETLTNFYENVYMYLTENFSWNGDEEAEKKVMNNIAKAFGILPYKPLLQVVNGRTQKRNVIQMMRYDDGTRIHVSFNYSKECVYIGQFQLGSFSTQEQAQQFLESAKARLKMNDLRMTRIIGSPTDKVNLIFAALSDEQINALKGLAKKHGQVLSECGS